MTDTAALSRSDAPVWYESLPRSTKAPIISGVLILVAMALGFGFWGSAAPIAGAVVASGVFVATGQNKIIQHLEGGVIKDIHVKEGDLVEQGQALLELDETAPRAELRRLEMKSARLTAIDARLQAEMREADNVDFQDELLAASSDPEVREILKSQLSTFTARRNNLQSDIASIEQSISGLNERIHGSTIQLAAAGKQIRLLDDEISIKEGLLRTGLVRKPEVMALQRTQANLEGETGRIKGDIGDARDRIARANEQINGVRKAFIKTAVEQMHENRGELADVRERMSAARAVLGRIRISAPVRGIVVKLRYHTLGGVIEAGKNIVEILPLKDELVIEARVRPQDIDNVRNSHKAMVRLTALSQRVTPMVSGEVIYLSADSLADEKKSQQVGPTDIYLVRIKLDPLEAAQIEGFHPTPGMPAEVYIKTSERTFFQYIVRPIQDSMARAFRNVEAEEAVEVEEIDSFAALLALEQQWNAVYDADGDAQLFLSWQWLLPWLRGLSGPWMVLAVKTRQNGAPRYVAFLPLKLHTAIGKTGAVQNELRMLGNFAADYTGLICDPRWDGQALPALGRRLRKMTWGRLHLENIRLSETRLRLLLSGLGKADFALEDVNRIGRIDGIDNNVCPYIPLPNDWDAYLAGLSANTRQKLRRLLRMVDDGASFRITHADAQSIGRDLDQLLAFWEAKWKLRKAAYIASLVRSNRAMLHFSFKAGLLLVPTLWHDDKPIASLAILVDPRKRTYLFYMTGRDETFDGPSPGQMLHGHSIRHAIAQGFKEYDFLRGNESYKYSFGVSERRIRYLIVNPRRGIHLSPVIDPRSILDVLNQATSFHRAGKLPKAEQAYRQVLAADPEQVDALYRLAQLLFGMLDHAGAARLLGRLTKLKPDLYKPWMLLGECYEKLGQDLGAASCYSEVVRIKPDLPEVFPRLAALLSRNGRLDVVNNALSLALSAGPPLAPNDADIRLPKLH